MLPVTVLLAFAVEAITTAYCSVVMTVLRVKVLFFELLLNVTLPAMLLLSMVLPGKTVVPLTVA